MLLIPLTVLLSLSRAQRSTCEYLPLYAMLVSRFQKTDQYPHSAIIGSGGPALKAFTKKHIPNFLSSSRGGGATSGNASWSPERCARDRLTGRSSYSLIADKSGSQLGRSTDAQYGMSILKTSRYDVETSSQEEMVSKEEIDRSRSESVFGSQEKPKKVSSSSTRGDP
jgi:hypothetical protein